MNFRLKNLAASLLIACSWLLLLPASTQARPHHHSSSAPAASAPAASAPAASVPDASQPAASSPQPAVTVAEDDQDTDDDANQLVSIGHDTHLAAGQRATQVVSVFGSSSADGDVNQDVVSVIGNTRVTGKVGGSAVAVLGDNDVDGEVTQDVVAVLGHITLGPHARIHGQLVDVLGSISLDPAAQVNGGTQSILPGLLPEIPGMQAWFRHGPLLGRPLFLQPALGLIWSIAAIFLALYVIIALLFHDAVERCVQVLEHHPGKSLLTALLACIITPLVLLLLLVTVIGIPAVPVVILGLVCATLFGKAAVLAWLGHRGMALGRPGPRTGAGPTALAVLLGGLMVSVAYLVPVLGILVFLGLSMLGYGAVLYTLLDRMRGPQPPAQRSAAATADATSRPAATADSAATEEPPPHDAAPGPAADPAPAVPLMVLPRAGFWIRMGALLIDLVLVSVVLELLGGWHGHGGRMDVVVTAIYGAIMWQLKGTTVGGIVFDLHVVREDGGPLDWSTAIIRALGCLLSMAAVGLGFIWIAVDPGRQAWHDKLAGTIVVRRPRQSPAR